MPISKYAFPNAATVAEFRPHSLTLHFHETNRQQFADVFSRSPKLVGDSEPIQTLYHELTHWSDCVSSVWGQHYINKLFKTFDVISGRDEADFYKYVSFFDEDRRIMFPKYYHVVEREKRVHGPELPWGISFSCGQEFDSEGKINPARPIFFVCFEDNITRERVARQPISVGSLLETTAVWSELLVESMVLAEVETDEANIERRIQGHKRLRALYDKEMTIYSAPAHMLAHFCHVSNLAWTYERGALLASIALNMTPPHFKQMRHPERFNHFGSRRKAFLRAENRGYAYAALAAHAGTVNSELSLEPWLAELLAAANLPSYRVMCCDALGHLGTYLPQRTKDPRTEVIRRHLLEVGRKRSQARSERAPNLKHFEPLGIADSPLPLLFDADGNTFGIGDDHISRSLIDPEAMLQFEYAIDDAIHNFLQGCRGLE